MVFMEVPRSSPQRGTTALCRAPQRLLLTMVLVLSQSIEIDQRLDKKSRQGFPAASAVAWENEINSASEGGKLVT